MDRELLHAPSCYALHMVSRAGQGEEGSGGADSDTSTSSSGSDNVNGFLQRESYMPGKAAAQQQQQQQPAQQVPS